MRRFAAGAAVVVAALAIAPPAAADPAPAISPGEKIGVYDAAGASQGACTLGFIASGPDGAQHALTAGHCASDGDVVMEYQQPGNYLRLGRFAESVSQELGDGGDPNYRDMGDIRLNSDLPKVDARVAGQIPVRGVTSRLEKGDVLCVWGARTGRQVCGPVIVDTLPDDTSVSFDALTQPGDSGSPVYRLEPDGTATAVGIAIHGSVRTGRSIAQLVEPYLQTWNLTLDVTAPSATPVRFGLAAGIGVGLLAVLGTAAAAWAAHRRRMSSRKDVRELAGSR